MTLGVEKRAAQTERERFLAAFVVTNGLTTREAAERLGVSNSTVWHALQACGCRERRRWVWPDDDA